ncbi:amidohydrolase [Dehalococcoidia bacterium]|nr:amidohydrolase [Dehalococcoidia bacterium]
MAKHTVVSADSHLDLGYLPPDTFTSRVSTRWQDKVPRVKATPDGALWVAGKDGEHKLGGLGGGVPKRRNLRNLRMTEVGFWDNARRPYDTNLRLADQEMDCVDAEVVYGITFLAEMMQEQDLAAVSINAYNEFVAHWAKAAPGRLYPQGLLPGNTVEAAVDEVQHIARLGLRGAQWDYIVTSKPIWHPYWEPLWSAAADHDIILSIHAPMFGTTTVGKLPGLDSHPASEAAWLAVIPLQLDEAICSVIYTGVLERYPNLRVVITESGIGWIPYLLDRMDYEWADHSQDSTWSDLNKELPSDLFRRQMYATFQKDNVGPLLAEQFCPNNFMWGSDYPHPDGVWPDSQAAINECLGKIDAGLRRKIVNDNARRLYNMA